MPRVATRLFRLRECDLHMLQEATAVANNKHKEESSAKPKAAVDETATSSAAASVAANTETAATPRPVREWSVGDVQAFFIALELGEYNAAIKKEKVDGRMLQALQSADGLGELGIKSKVHLLRIKHGLEDAAQGHAKDTGGNAVVRLLCLPRSHHLLPCFWPLCRAAAHVRHVQVQACVRPHVVPAAARG